VLHAFYLFIGGVWAFEHHELEIKNVHQVPQKLYNGCIACK
jgi:hypothetical protein